MIKMAEEIDELKNWVNKQRQISFEGTILFFVGLVVMLIGMFNTTGGYGLTWTTAGGFMFLGGILYINLNKINRFR